MVMDRQARGFRKLMKGERTLANAPAIAGMDEKTARKYRNLGRLPNEVKAAERTWRTWPDPFAEVWDEVRDKLETNTGMEAKTLFGGSSTPQFMPICGWAVEDPSPAGEDLACT